MRSELNSRNALNCLITVLFSVWNFRTCCSRMQFVIKCIFLIYWRSKKGIPRFTHKWECLTIVENAGLNFTFRKGAQRKRSFECSRHHFSPMKGVICNRKSCLRQIAIQFFKVHLCVVLITYFLQLSRHRNG